MSRPSIDSIPSLVPDTTPNLQSEDQFETQTPSLEDIETLDDTLYPTSLDADTIHPISKITTSPLTQADLKKDPILSSLAKQQRVNTPTSIPSQKQVAIFKAKPAPSSMRDEGLGPRMTKSAALRLGLQWEGEKKVRTGNDGMGFENTPGHKRASMGIAIASLSSPSLAPRQNKSSQLRSGQAASSLTPKRDPQAIAAANKARADEEKAKRRASVVMPASLSAPSIAPRANKASALRTGVQPTHKSSSSTSTGTMSRIRSTLGLTDAMNVSKPVSSESDKAGRRASVAGVRSLGAPSIAPRLNKAALLRAPGLSGTNSSATIQAKTVPVIKLSSSTPMINKQPRVSAVRSAPPRDDHAGPKPTKSSMLRAGLGAKLISR